MPRIPKNRTINSAPPPTLIYSSAHRALYIKIRRGRKKEKKRASDGDMTSCPIVTTSFPYFAKIADLTSFLGRHRNVKIILLFIGTCILIVNNKELLIKSAISIEYAHATAGSRV